MFASRLPGEQVTCLNNGVYYDEVVNILLDKADGLNLVLPAFGKKVVKTMVAVFRKGGLRSASLHIVTPAPTGHNQHNQSIDICLVILPLTSQEPWCRLLPCYLSCCGTLLAVPCAYFRCRRTAFSRDTYHNITRELFPIIRKPP